MTRVCQEGGSIDALARTDRIARQGVREGGSRGIAQAPDGKGDRVDVVATPEDIPSDQQLIDNDILIPFAGSETRTINSPIALRGADKVQPRMPPSVGQHSDEVLKEAGFDAATIAQMRAVGAIGWSNDNVFPVIGSDA